MKHYNSTPLFIIPILLLFCNCVNENYEQVQIEEAQSRLNFELRQTKNETIAQINTINHFKK